MKKIPGIIMTSIFAVGLVGSITTAVAITNNRHFGENEGANALTICSRAADHNNSLNIMCTYNEYVTYDISRNIRDYLGTLTWDEDNSFSSHFENFDDFDDTINIRLTTWFTEYILKINKDYSKCAVRSNKLLTEKDVKIYNFKKENGTKLTKLIIEGSKENEK